tara:strand:- start:372 stop:974 length:603 start_codon:yes stop_codon:yes gene_type:complete
MLLTSNIKAIDTICSLPSSYTAERINNKGKVVGVVANKNTIYRNFEVIQSMVPHFKVSDIRAEIREVVEVVEDSNTSIDAIATMESAIDSTKWWKAVPAKSFDIPINCFTKECQNKIGWQLRVYMTTSTIGPSGFLNIAFPPNTGYAPWGIWLIRHESKNHLPAEDFTFAYQAAKLFTLTFTSANKKWAQNLSYEFPAVD